MTIRRLVGVLIVLSVVSGGTLNAVSLTLVRVVGDPSSPEAGTLTLDPSDGGRIPLAYRCAQTFPDLALTAWTPISTVPLVFTRLMPGFQWGSDAIVTCEVSYDAGPTVRVSAVEDLTSRNGASILPRQFLRPSLGVLFHLLAGNTVYGAWPVVQYNDNGQSLMRFALGNNFVPLEWSDDGYAWSSQFTRAIDEGEPRLNTVLAAHVSARWLGPSSVMDFSPNTTAMLVDLAGESLDLKGGKIYFSVLMALPDGRHARYHLRRPLTVRNGRWTDNGWYVPSGAHPDWECSFASNYAGCAAMPAPGPDLRYIAALELVITDGAAPPTGVLKMRDLQVWQ